MNKFFFFCGFLLSLASHSEEFKLCSGQTTWANIFQRIEKPLAQKQNISFVLGTDPNSSSSIENLKSLIEGKCEAAVNAMDFNVWVKNLKEKKFEFDESKLTYRVIGRDYAKVITNKDVGLSKLSFEQLTALFSGRIKNWKEIGGKDLTVRIFLSQLKTGTAGVFKQKVMGNKEFSSEIGFVPFYEDVMIAVEKTPGGIGLVPFKNPKNTVVAPITDDIGRPVTMVTVGKPSQKVLKILQFISGEGKKLVD